MPYVGSRRVRAGGKTQVAADYRPLSWPHAGAMMEGGIEVDDAVNQAMDRSDWPAYRMMRVTELAEAAAILQSLGVRDVQ